MAMKIPEAHRGILAQLASLSSEAIDKLAEALGKATPAMLPGGLARQIGPVSTEIGLSPRDIVGLLVSLEMARTLRRLSVPDLIRDIVQAANSSALFGTDEAAAKSSSERLAENLAKLFSVGDALEITSRLSDIYFSHERLFRRARIFSDIRPVFKSDGVETPLVGAIVHNLAVTTSDSDGEQRTKYVAMNIHDLKELKTVIERALAKDEALRKTITQSGMTYVEDVPGEHQK